MPPLRIQRENRRSEDEGDCWGLPHVAAIAELCPKGQMSLTLWPCIERGSNPASALHSSPPTFLALFFYVHELSTMALHLARRAWGGAGGAGGEPQLRFTTI